MVACPPSQEALRLYWRFATPANDLLGMLKSESLLDNKRFFADMIREITIEIKAPGHHHGK